MDTRIIYTKTFSELDIETLEQEMDAEAKSAFTTKFETGEEFLNYISENTRFEEVPHRVEWKDSYVESIVSFCDLNEIDVTIKETEGALNTTIQLPIGCYMGYVKNRLVEIMYLSDDISILPNKDKPDYITIALTYYTHERYIAGKKTRF